MAAYSICEAVMPCVQPSLPVHTPQPKKRAGKRKGIKVGRVQKKAHNSKKKSALWTSEVREVWASAAGLGRQELLVERTEGCSLNGCAWMWFN